MATLFHFSNFFTSISPRHISSSNYFSAFQNPLLAYHQHSLPSRHQHFAICSSSIRKPRASKKLMSDADLCNELRKFSSSFGFENGHVPSMKELSHHGRKDLAYIVRRRGYKLIGELLANSTEGDCGELDIERNLDRLRATGDCGDGITGQDEKAGNSDELVKDNNNGGNNLEAVLEASEKNPVNVDVKSPALTSVTLQEKVEKFIRNGELDVFEDEIQAEISKGNLMLDNSVNMDPKTSEEEHLDFLFSEIDDPVSTEQNTPPALENGNLRDGLLLTEPPGSADFEKDLDVEDSEKGNQAEINHLKLMLHQKESELSRLKELIEKEKVALSAMQIKVESEIGKAQQLISEKDEELQVAEEGLLGLKEVLIQYRANGECVEMAGSFNGWHHRVKLDPQPYSSMVEPSKIRESRVWSTVLWLYPGEYEIKFVVDGQWMIDPDRELVTRGTFHNNVLRVDK